MVLPFSHFNLFQYLTQVRSSSCFFAFYSQGIACRQSLACLYTQFALGQWVGQTVATVVRVCVCASSSYRIIIIVWWLQKKGTWNVKGCKGARGTYELRETHVMIFGACFFIVSGHHAVTGNGVRSIKSRKRYVKSVSRHPRASYPHFYTHLSACAVQRVLGMRFLFPVRARHLLLAASIWQNKQNRKGGGDDHRYVQKIKIILKKWRPKTRPRQKVSVTPSSSTISFPFLPSRPFLTLVYLFIYSVKSVVLSFVSLLYFVFLYFFYFRVFASRREMDNDHEIDIEEISRS